MNSPLLVHISLENDISTAGTVIYLTLTFYLENVKNQDFLQDQNFKDQYHDFFWDKNFRDRYRDFFWDQSFQDKYWDFFSRLNFLRPIPRLFFETKSDTLKKVRNVSIPRSLETKCHTVVVTFRRKNKMLVLLVIKLGIPKKNWQLCLILSEKSALKGFTL